MSIRSFRMAKLIMVKQGIGIGAEVLRSNAEASLHRWTMMSGAAMLALRFC